MSAFDKNVVRSTQQHDLMDSGERLDVIVNQSHPDLHDATELELALHEKICFFEAANFSLEVIDLMKRSLAELVSLRKNQQPVVRLTMCAPSIAALRQAANELLAAIEKL